jgi:hypothetical protein
VIVRFICTQESASRESSLEDCLKPTSRAAKNRETEDRRMCSSYTLGMGSTRIDGAAPAGADLADVAEDGVPAEAIRTAAGFLRLGLRSFRERVSA